MRCTWASPRIHPRLETKTTASWKRPASRGRQQHGSSAGPRDICRVAHSATSRGRVERVTSGSTRAIRGPNEERADLMPRSPLALTAQCPATVR